MQTRNPNEKPHGDDNGNGVQNPPAHDEPATLAHQALEALEALDETLDHDSAHWLHSMIDVLRVYVDCYPEIPDRMSAAYHADGVVLRRGLQSFVVSEPEFAEVRNAFRRCKHYQKKRELKDEVQKVLPNSFGSY